MTPKRRVASGRGSAEGGGPRSRGARDNGAVAEASRAPPLLRPAGHASGWCIGRRRAYCPRQGGGSQRCRQRQDIHEANRPAPLLSRRLCGSTRRTARACDRGGAGERAWAHGNWQCCLVWRRVSMPVDGRKPKSSWPLGSSYSRRRRRPCPRRRCCRAVGRIVELTGRRGEPWQLAARAAPSPRQAGRGSVAEQDLARPLEAQCMPSFLGSPSAGRSTIS